MTRKMTEVSKLNIIKNFLKKKFSYFIRICTSFHRNVAASLGSPEVSEGQQVQSATTPRSATGVEVHRKSGTTQGGYGRETGSWVAPVVYLNDKCRGSGRQDATKDRQERKVLESPKLLKTTNRTSYKGLGPGVRSLLLEAHYSDPYTRKPFSSVHPTGCRRLEVVNESTTDGRQRVLYGRKRRRGR